MQYQKIQAGNLIIEFHNSWTGEETVTVNGKIVSQKSSIWGTQHYFTIMESGHQNRYVLTSKVNPTTLQVLLDLSKNGMLVQKDIPLHFGSKRRKPANKAKKEGMAHLKEYELDDALASFEKALQIAPNDPEIHFHMACAYSVLERTVEGFEALKKAVEFNLDDTESILKHDMLAFLRMNEAFEDFLKTGFTEYEAENVKKGDFNIWNKPLTSNLRDHGSTGIAGGGNEEV